MPNMDHARFRNTLVDLKECYDALSTMDGEDLRAFFATDTPEKKAAVRLILMCGAISADYNDDAERA